MSEPLVTVITPLGPDPEHLRLLRDRARPSVHRQSVGAQAWRWWIVSQSRAQDPGGPGEVWLRCPAPRARMACPETWSLRWALERVQTPYVAYLGADDELGETHLELHVQALQRHELSLSSVEFRVAGQRRMTLSAAPAHGSVDLNGIAHRTELRDLSTWQDSPDRCPDWELVRRWLAARVTWTTIPVVTAIHHDGWLAGTTPRRSLLASSR